MPELQRLDVEDHDRILEILDTDGGVIVKHYLDTDKLARVRDALANTIVDAPVIMSTGEFMAVGPDETQQRLHRDADSWLRADLHRDFLFNVNIALTDFRRDNGATVVVPGCHRWPKDPRRSGANMPTRKCPRDRHSCTSAA